MSKKDILLLIAIIIIIVSAVKIAEFFKTNIIEGDATRFVVEDLHSKYPGADIDIISVQKMTNDEGGQYFEIKAKVTKNPYGPCPERMHLFYNYPVQNFVPRQPEIITADCEVCTDQSCLLVFPEEAVIASHVFNGTEAVDAYLKLYPGTKADVSESATGWTVIWNSPDSDHYYVVEILKNNKIGIVKKVNK